MRLQLGFPDTFSFITPENYLQHVSMHGMIMVVYLLTALFLGGFGNYMIPLMVGARDLGFPFDNMLSFWWIGRAHVDLQSLIRIAYAVFVLKNKHEYILRKNNS